MIEVKNLTKVYGKGKNAVNALQGASFTLPDKGLVFIVGKSGSGKSTLLNILGGLDDATSGEIFVNGEDITKLKPRELDNYRNYFVGIVYQNFNLFEDETVLQNVRIATDISDHKIDDKTIDVVIDRLDLTEKKNALVRELSGGQKQRVAIARALAKYPHMILADEPTGNLDSKTSIAIHNYLQRISREKLVVVISHDMKNANNYADRIIEIADGKVVNNIIRDESLENENEISVNSEVSDEKIREINGILKEKGIRLTKKQTGFIPNQLEEHYTGEKISFKGRNKSRKNSLRLAYRFWNSSKASFFITAIISTLIISLLAVAHGFAVYDGSKAIKTATERYQATNFVMQKGFSSTSKTNDINDDYIIRMDENDIQEVQNEEKYGKSHLVYPIVLFNGPDHVQKYQARKEIDGLWCNSSLGVMTADMDYINRIFDNPEILAGSFYNLENEPSIIITDYMADSILLNDATKRLDGLPIYSADKNDPYASLVGTVLCSNNLLFRQKVAAVIKTNYKEKYDFIFKMFDEALKESQNTYKLVRKLLSSDLFIQFQNDVKTKYAFCYSFDQNFLQDYLDSELATFAYFKNAQFVDSNGAALINFGNEDWLSISDELNEGEILINEQISKELFEESDPTTKSIRLETFDYNQNSTDFPVYQSNFVIKGKFISSHSEVMRMSRVDFNKFAKIFFAPYAVSFENVNNSHFINSNLTPMYFYSQMAAFNSVFQLIDIIQIFSKVFLFIALLLIALVVMVVVSHNFRIIKKNQYRLGVYKSLGYSAAALGESTILNSLIMVGTLIIITTLFMLGLSSVMNLLLTGSFATFLNNDIFLSLTLVEFSIPTLAIYLGGVTVLILLTTFLPVISIRKIKPNIIINRAD